jgi:hypothetical protein
LNEITHEQHRISAAEDGQILAGWGKIARLQLPHRNTPQGSVDRCASAPGSRPSCDVDGKNRLDTRLWAGSAVHDVEESVTATQGTECCQERYIRQRVPAAARQLSRPVYISTVGSQSVAIFYIDSTSPIQVLHPRQPCQKCSPGSLLSLFLQASLLTVYVPLLRLKGDTTNIYSGKHPIQGILTWKTRPPFSPLRAWMTQVEPSYRSTTAS